MVAAGAAALRTFREHCFVVPEGSVAVVERFGRYHRTLQAGLNFTIPFADSLRNRLDLREQTIPFPVRVVAARDGANLPVELVVQYSVQDPEKATYGVSSYIAALERHTLYEISHALSKLSTQPDRASLAQLAADVTTAIKPRAERWGLRLHEVLAVSGEVEVSEVHDDARVSADHNRASASVYASTVTMNVMAHGRVGRQDNWVVDELSNWRIDRQEIQGNAQQGDNNLQDNRTGLSTADVLQIQELISRSLEVLSQAPIAEDAASERNVVLVQLRDMNDEVELARREDRAPDVGRLRRAWAQLAAAAGPAVMGVAGGAAAELIRDLGRAIGVS
ncbi:SPFH domain-containing protein [Streptomyces sp. BH106]|uniref:SPFH domain-containing protein n=1 Tax=Streptomyces sp. BH106 TaxID=3410409 RepID=UPI003CF6DCB2